MLEMFQVVVSAMGGEGGEGGEGGGGGGEGEGEAPREGRLDYRGKMILAPMVKVGCFP